MTRLFSALHPDRIAPSAYEIDYRQEMKEGIRGVIFDIDNTLVPHGCPADERAVRLFSGLKGLGLKTCLVSNNHEERVQPFAEKVGAQYVFDAGKPLKKAYLKGAEAMGLSKEEVLAVGDQIFTDIYGAKRQGIRHYMVPPLDEATDPPFVRFKRKIERLFRLQAKEKNKLKNSER